MDATTLEWVLGLVIPAWFGTAAWGIKNWSDSKGWKVSYEREKEASDRAEQRLRDAAMSTDIANKTAEALYRLSTNRGVG